MKTTQKLWLGVLILAILSPLGLILPYYFKAGKAWGEGDRTSCLWRAPLPDYSFKGWEKNGLGVSSFAYIVSAVIGIIAIICVVLLIGKFLSRKD